MSNPIIDQTSGHTGRRVLVLAPQEARVLADAIVEAHPNDRVYVVTLGESTRRPSAGAWEIDAAAPDALAAALRDGMVDPDIVYFLGGVQQEDATALFDDGALARSQSRGVLSLFRLVKALGSGLAKREVVFKVVTNDTYAVVAGDVVRPLAASIHGFVGVMAQEYPKARVLSVDLSLRGQDVAAERAAARAIVAREVPPGLTEFAWRDGAPFKRVLERVELPAAAESPLRRGGVYLFLGGAGGIGAVVSRSLAQTYGAQLVWIGRSALDARRQKEIAEIEALGGRVLYLRADAADAGALRRAVETARAELGPIRGAFHSAIVLADKRIATMDEASFLTALVPKVHGSVNLARALEGEPLDFLMFFSSAQSFGANQGQSNYAAGCTFKDAFATWLSANAPYPVKIVNWGYWGSVGAVASDMYRKKLGAMGVYSIEPPEGVEAVTRVLAHPVDQVMAFKGSDALLASIGAQAGEGWSVLPAVEPSVFEALVTAGSSRPLESDEAAWAATTRFGRRLLVATLRKMGVLTRPGERYTRSSFAAKLGIVPSYARMHDALVDLLVAARVLRDDGMGSLVVGDGEFAQARLDDAALAREKATLARDFPAMRELVDLIALCVESYPEVLTGRRAAHEVIFPGSSMHLLEGIYKGNATADYFNAIMADVAVAYVEARRGSGRRVRVLEVGSGTGGTSAHVIPALARLGDAVEYVYTDLSRAFLAHGKRHFGQHPFVRFAALDIEKDGAAQGFEQGAFDLVLATNVLHATKRMGPTLANIKRLLLPRGCLLVNESTAVRDFTTLIFGMLDGWWVFEDEACRLRGSPLLSEGLWERALSVEGYRRVAGLGRTAANAEPNQLVLVAESDGVIRGTAVHAAPPPRATVPPAAPPVVVPVAAPPAPPVQNRARIERAVLECVASVLEIEPGKIARDDAFQDIGVDSVLSVEIANRIAEALTIELRSTDLFNFGCVNDLVAHIDATFALPAASAPPSPIDAATTSDFPVLVDDEATSDFPVFDDDEPASDFPVLVDTPPPAVLASGVHSLPPPMFDAEAAPAPVPGGVAVIGMAGRFPGARDIGTLWANLCEGVSSVSTPPEGRWDLDAFFGDLPRRSDRPFPGRAGFLDSIDTFDSLFFGISPKEAELMNPQQRLFLEEAWRAFEDAGYSSEMLAGRRTGVYMGCNGGDYTGVLRQLGIVEEPYALMGNSGSIQPARVSYLLNLRGPAIALDTACSSSLVAIHLACEAIRAGSVDMALAGGSMVMTTPEFALLANQAGMLAPDGQCKTFDNSADGFVPAEGVGLVVLKDLSAALRDGDRIYAVVRGSGINQDGKTNGITAPSAPSQTALELEVYATSGVDPSSITYIEAHGTGTKLGDPIEVQALTDAFRQYTDRRGFCALGSIKTNFGHGAMAAGVAGFIKTALALQHAQIPPSLNFEHANEHIAFERTPFFVNTQLRDWERPDGAPRRAAVSSFGFSGTNAHIVLEEAPEAPPRAAPTAGPWPFAVSARSPAALARRLRDLAAWLDRDGGRTPLEDVAYTLLCRRTHFPVRAVIVAADVHGLSRGIALALAGDRASGVIHADLRAARVVVETMHEEVGARVVEDLARGVRDEAERARKVTVVSDLYAKGYELPYASLFANARIATLPTYPFEPVRHWPAALPAKAATEDGTTVLALLERVWDASAGAPGETPPPGATLLVLTNDETRAAARRLCASPDFAPTLAAMRARFVHCGTHPDAAARPLDPANAVAGRALARQILREDASVRAIVDLSDVFARGRGDMPDAGGKFALLQELLRAHVEERRDGTVHVLHVTRGLVALDAHATGAREPLEPTLSGALFAGLMPVLGAEYQRVNAKHIDVDFAPGDARALTLLVERELGTRDAGAAVCVRSGARYVAALRELRRERAEDLRLDAPGTRFPVEKVLLITGGTGGIGRALARRWVDKGARKLVLMGRDPLPPRRSWDALLGDPGADPAKVARVRDIRELEARGAQVELYIGSLTDRGALSALLGRVRRTMGPIGGVFHCAGAFADGYGPFIHRNTDDMRRVLEPKTHGLLALADALDGDTPDFFVLVSSVSALFPTLSVGLADYAVGNAFLSSFAEYQWKRGRRYFTSQAWSNWRDVGVGEIDSANYRQLALETHSTPQGMQMLDRAMAEGAPVVAVSLFDGARYDTARLLQFRHERHERHEKNEPQAEKQRPVHGDEAIQPPVPATADADAEARRWLTDIFTSELKIAKDELDENRRFEELGVDSILMVSLLKKIEKALGAPVDPTALLEYPTLRQLGQYFVVQFQPELRLLLDEPEAPATVSDPIAARAPADPNVEPVRSVSARAVGPKIAVIGLGCRFPQSPDAPTFFRNLAAGFDGIREVPPSRWDAATFYSRVHTTGKSISKWGGFLDGIEDWDPTYFGLREESAAQVDPLIRLFLESSIQCVRDAGYDEAELSRVRAGVFVGTRTSNYARRIATPTPDMITGIGQNFIAAHVSHLLDLHGPSLVVDTACSSSLVAIHMACQSLVAGDCEVALVGGVDVLLDELTYLTLSEARALSPDGRCFTFDGRANGFVPGEGCGVALLKPLERAIADGDRIYAVIDASAVNNDGRTMGITTPNPEAQYEVIKDAMTKAGVRADTITYVEAHGTGTMIGDPIELKGLVRVFREHTEDRGFCAVGSVKSNIGHTFSAAGIASFIKVVLCLHHGKLVPTLHCDTPNPRFAFDDSPFWPNTTLRDWEPRHGVRRAGMSSFGFGGTNAHVIVEDFRAAEAPGYAPARHALAPAVFQRKRYWLEREPSPAVAAPPPVRPAVPPLGGLLELEWEPAKAVATHGVKNGVSHANGAKS